MDKRLSDSLTTSFVDLETVMHYVQYCYQSSRKETTQGVLRIRLIVSL